MINHFPLSIAAMLVGFSFATSSVGSEFRILLNDVSLTAPDQQITIGDVADITGGTPSIRERIAALDLETLGHDSKDCRITRREIELRVMVDGHAKNRFDVIGPNEVSIRCSIAKEFRGKVEQLITVEICRQFGLDPENVAVRLADEQQIKTAETKLLAEDFSATVLFQPQLPIGKTQVQVEFEQPGGSRFLQHFDAQVIISMEVAVATRGIPKGTTVDRDMIRVIKRPIHTRENFAEPDRVIGRVAKQDITSNEVILGNAITSPTTRNTPIIKRNDILDVIVEVGSSQIRLKNARALSQGNVGESILILNTRSNKQFSATVVDRSLAKISPLFGGR